MSKQRILERLEGIASQPGNNICADCNTRHPRYASSNLGIFLCQNCAIIHRRIGAHITRVKKLTDGWTREEVEFMGSNGNINSNRLYNPNPFRNPPPQNLQVNERDSELERYIRAKYEHKRFYDRSARATVTSLLGPSRSMMSSAQIPPSAPLPQPRSNTTTTPYGPTSHSLSSSYPAPPNPQLLSPRPPQQSTWDDLNLLENNTQNPSLPLQYQPSTYSQGSHLMHLPALNGAMGVPNNYPVTASGMGLNPSPPRTNPFSQQPSQFSPTPTTNFRPYGQQFNPSQSLGHQPVTPYFHPQPQTSLQIQNSSSYGFISESPNPPLAPPTGPSPFTSEGHPSSMPPQKYISNSPQQMQPPTQLYPHSAPAPPGGHNVSGPSQISGMTTMQQQMQEHFQQQQNYYPSQPQMPGQVYGQQPLLHPQGGFSSQAGSGGQWNTNSEHSLGYNFNGY